MDAKGGRDLGGYKLYLKRCRDNMEFIRFLQLEFSQERSSGHPRSFLSKYEVCRLKIKTR